MELDRSAFLAAVAIALGMLTLAGGWVASAAEPSPAASAPSNLALGRPYTVTATWPDPLFARLEADYPDTGKAELTDGKKASASYSHPAWQAFTRQAARRIRVDLGQIATVTEVMGRFLQFRAAGVYVPRYVRFSLSVDGERWVPAGQVETAVGPWNEAVQAEEIRLGGLRHEARYVQLEFPVDVMVMMDEVEVYGQAGLAPDAVRLADAAAGSVRSGGDGNAPDHTAGTAAAEVALQGAAISPRPGYLLAGSPQVSGARHIALAVYAYPPNPRDGEWGAADYLPYVGYISEDGQLLDWMFDTILLSPQGATPKNHKFGAVTPAESTDKEDWDWYLDETFRPGYQLDALEVAVGQAKKILGAPDYKVKVFLTLVNASPGQRAFGDLDGDGKPESFDWRQVGREQALAHRIAAERWLIGEFLRRWEEQGYEHLELAGFYWQMEAIHFAHSPDEDRFVRAVGDLVRERGLKFLWIPFYGAEGSYDWMNYGFDAALLQPNYMFSEAGPERLKVTADIAQALGMGVEIEKHWKSDWSELQKWLEYLKGGVEHGYMKAVVGYYQGFKDFGRAAYGDAASRRLYYEFVYQFIKGTYQPVSLPGL